MKVVMFFICMVAVAFLAELHGAKLTKVIKEENVIYSYT